MKMNKIRLLGALMLGLVAAVVMSSCSDDEQSPEPTQQNDKYCLMYYAVGGDEAHDNSFFQPIQYAAESTVDNVAITCLLKSSSEGTNPNHVAFYT